MGNEIGGNDISIMIINTLADQLAKMTNFSQTILRGSLLFVYKTQSETHQQTTTIITLSFLFHQDSSK